MSQPLLLELHCHSTCSDGLCSPAELVEQAVGAGLSALALTDHDTTAGWESLAAAAAGRLEAVSGVELSCRLRVGVGQRAREVPFHLLGYFFDPTDGPLQTLMEEQRRQRRLRMAGMLERLDRAGLRLPEEAREALNRDNPGRGQLARALVEAGLVSDREEVFKKYLGRGKRAYLPGSALEAEEAIRALQAAGGVAVLAHPGLEDAYKLVKSLALMGLDGLEAYHPRHARERVEQLLGLARERGLLITGGSDYHGPEGPHAVRLGSVRVPWDTLERLRACSRIRNSNAR